MRFSKSITIKFHPEKNNKSLNPNYLLYLQSLFQHLILQIHISLNLNKTEKVQNKLPKQDILASLGNSEAPVKQVVSKLWVSVSQKLFFTLCSSLLFLGGYQCYTFRILRKSIHIRTCY